MTQTNRLDLGKRGFTRTKLNRTARLCIRSLTCNCEMEPFIDVTTSAVNEEFLT